MLKFNKLVESILEKDDPTMSIGAKAWREDIIKTKNKINKAKNFLKTASSDDPKEWIKDASDQIKGLKTLLGLQQKGYQLSVKKKDTDPIFNKIEDLKEKYAKLLKKRYK
jgi:hypothetical protein